MIYFQKVNNNNLIRTLSQASIEIFKEHYIPILGDQQVEYMIGLFHTPSAIKRQMSEGCNFYLVFSNTTPCGFFGIEKHGARIFLSKLYLAKHYRNEGTGRRMLKKIIELSEKETAIYLTVNKHNDSSLGFYIHEGFKKIGDLVTDIGNNYVMDDYIMEKKITRESELELEEKVKEEKVEEINPVKVKKATTKPKKEIDKPKKVKTERVAKKATKTDK